MTAPDIPDRDVRDRLRALRVDPPPGDFAAALHRRLVEAGPPPPAGAWERLRLALGGRRARWGAVLGAAAAACLALLVVRAAAPARRDPLVTFSAAKVAVIRVQLSTDVAVASADIEVHLPDGLVFWSDGQALPERSFAWSQPLARGANEIPIAVRGARPGRYHVAVVARIDGQQVVDDVALEVTDG